MPKYCIVIGTVDIADVVPISETMQGDEYILDIEYDDYQTAYRTVLHIREVLMERVLGYLGRTTQKIEGG